MKMAVVARRKKEIQVEINEGISLVTEYLESQPSANSAILPQQLHQSQAFSILHFCTWSVWKLSSKRHPVLQSEAHLLPWI